MSHNEAMLEKKKERVGIRGKKWEKSIVHEKNCNSPRSYEAILVLDCGNCR